MLMRVNNDVTLGLTPIERTFHVREMVNKKK